MTASDAQRLGVRFGVCAHHVSHVIEIDGRFSHEIDPAVQATELSQAVGGVVLPVIEFRPHTLLSIGIQHPSPSGDMKAFDMRMRQCLSLCHKGKQWPAQRALIRAMEHGFVSFDTAYHLSETLAAAMSGAPIPASSAREAALKAWETIRRKKAAAALAA